MLKEAFEGRIAVADAAKEWKEAIAMVIRPLEETGCAEPRYLEAIYQNVAENGDYFILMPQFAMPHTRPENGALKNGLSFLKLRKPVVFSGGQEVTYLIGITATDAEAHLDILSELAELLMETGVVEALSKADTAEDIQEILG